MEYLLSTDTINVNHSDRLNSTCLHKASEYCHSESIVRTLVSRMSVGMVNSRDMLFFHTALAKAVRWNNTVAVTILGTTDYVLWDHTELLDTARARYVLSITSHILYCFVKALTHVTDSNGKCP